MNNVTFLVELPPPFGGVTVKNNLIIDTVVQDTDMVNVVDIYEIKRNPAKALCVFATMINAFRQNHSIVYGFGSYRRIKHALKIQKIIGGKESLTKTTNVVMGGRFQEYLRDDIDLLRLLKDIKLNLVETEGMKKAFIDLGLINTEVFPNARKAYKSKEPITSGNHLRCVFFSKICKDKGVDYILSELDNIEGITIDFYGHIDADIREAFSQYIDTHSYAHYNGVFDAAKDDVYAELNQYDVLLLPTKWKGEGVPGILVESKMAGVAVITSNINYNAEIVRDGVEGIVLSELQPNSLRDAIQYLSDNKETLKNLKKGSFDSRLRYAMELYTDKLRSYFGL